MISYEEWRREVTARAAKDYLPKMKRAELQEFIDDNEDYIRKMYGSSARDNFEHLESDISGACYGLGMMW